ncbi:hypothetical protein MJO28_012383 [Puccinia striiformis f. sp. tritici]|uniref:Uncharacterized protein n=1 Tax=Puccinia striiformis f. sp. tritici TaxID=168172 RepID=A0ACC0E0Z5_9BASI|nr:hypothetical protein MJO28_012383 [Puccinia striiformis f. sp. tritici]
MVTVGDLPNHAHAGAIPAEKPDDDELDDVVERAIETSTEQGVPVPDSDVVKKLDDCATDILRQLCGPTKHITFYPTSMGTHDRRTINVPSASGSSRPLRHLTRYLCVMRISTSLHASNTFMTKKELYESNTKVFPNRRAANKVVDDLCKKFEILPGQLRIVGIFP